MSAKDDDLLENGAIIRRISRLGQRQPLHGYGKQQNGQNSFKGTSGNCLTAPGCWFGFDIWSDRIHGDCFHLCWSNALF
jgi:hypothetical protein